MWYEFYSMLQEVCKACESLHFANIHLPHLLDLQLGNMHPPESTLEFTDSFPYFLLFFRWKKGSFIKDEVLHSPRVDDQFFQGSDVMVTAQTGSGKTAAFLVALLRYFQRETFGNHPVDWGCRGVYTIGCVAFVLNWYHYRCNRCRQHWMTWCKSCSVIYNIYIHLSIYTPLKINMEHNHGGLEDHFPF